MAKQMKRKIYHGSSKIIEKPEFGYGKPYNDYGLGFYCTEQIDMAREWGVSKEEDGIANCYEIDCSGLKILNLNDENTVFYTGCRFCWRIENSKCHQLLQQRRKNISSRSLK